jgi:hypothetical protein
MDSQAPKRSIRTHSEGWSTRDLAAQDSYPSVEPASYPEQRYRDMPGKYAPPPFDYEYDRVSRSSRSHPRDHARPGESSRRREKPSSTRSSPRGERRARSTPEPVRDTAQDASAIVNTETALVLVPKEEEYHSDSSESYTVIVSDSEGEQERARRSASHAGRRGDSRRPQAPSRRDSEHRGRDRYNRPPPPRQQSHDPRYDERDGRESRRAPPRPAGYSVPPIGRRPEFDTRPREPEPYYRHVQVGSGRRDDVRYFGTGFAVPEPRQASYADYDRPQRPMRSSSMRPAESSRQGRPPAPAPTPPPAPRVEIVVIEERETRRGRNVRYY